jgi:hypothetical protein
MTWASRIGPAAAGYSSGAGATSGASAATIRLCYLIQCEAFFHSGWLGRTAAGPPSVIPNRPCRESTATTTQSSKPCIGSQR